ncbi:MAG: MFS transporter [Patescibacteria group bacterium]|nr:MFS transporter [Patescibacteria group bacterium]
MLNFFKIFKKEYLVVFLMSSSVVFSGSLIAPIEQRFISTLTENSVLLGLVFTMGTASLAVFALIFARLSRTYGKNKFIILGAALGILYPLIYATSTNVLQYMGGKLVFGFAGAMMGPLLIAYLQEHLSTEKNQGKLLGYLYSAQSIAGSFGAIIGGFVADKYFLGAPYYLQFIILLIPFFLALKFFGGEKEEIKKSEKKYNYLFGIKYIFSNPYLLYHLILEIPFKMNWSVKVILYPLIIISFIDSNVITGSVFATQGVVAMVVLLYAGTFVDKRSYMTGMKTSFLILALTASLMAFSTSLIMFWIFAALFAIGEAISGPSKGVLEIKNIENEHRAEVIAIFSIFGYLFEALSPFLAGILLAVLTPQMVLLFYALLIWIFFGIATIILKMRLRKNL